MSSACRPADPARYSGRLHPVPGPAMIAPMTAPPALLGSYRPPAVRVGGRAYCRFRKTWCRVTSWTDAPVPWPRGVPAGPGRKGFPGLIVTRALERAIRTESALALKHHFGVRTTLAWRYRKWAGVEGRRKTPGSRQLHQNVSEPGAAGIRAKDWTDEELDRKAEAARRCGTR